MGQPGCLLLLLLLIVRGGEATLSEYSYNTRWDRGQGNITERILTMDL